MEILEIKNYPYIGKSEGYNFYVWNVANYIRKNNYPDISITTAKIIGDTEYFILSSDPLAEQNIEVCFNPELNTVFNEEYATYVDNSKLHYITINIDGHCYGLSYWYNNK